MGNAFFIFDIQTAPKEIKEKKVKEIEYVMTKDEYLYQLHILEDGNSCVALALNGGDNQILPLLDIYKGVKSGNYALCFDETHTTFYSENNF